MKLKQFLIAVCIGTMFAACSSEESSQLSVPDNSIRLKATISPSATRATGTDDELQNSGYFYDDDDVKVNAYITEAGTENDYVSGQNENGYLGSVVKY